MSRLPLIPLERRRMSQWVAMAIINGTAFAITAGIFFLLKVADALFDIR